MEQLTSIALFAPFSCQSADEVFAHRQTLIPEVSPRSDMTESDVKPESATSLKEKAPIQPGTDMYIVQNVSKSKKPDVDLHNIGSLDS